MLPFALALAPLVHAPDGYRLKPITQCFAIERQGQVIGATYQRIVAVKRDGMKAWDIVVHQRAGNGRFDMRDHFILAATNLLPLSFDSRVSNKPHVNLTYRPGRVMGSRINADGTTVPINVLTNGPVWEGNLWGVTFGALPLAEGAHLTLPTYQYDQGVGAFDLKVTGSEQVDTPNGKVAAWTVDIEVAPGRINTSLIDKATGTELGSRAPGFATRLGGDCRGLG